jgi:single stranded DNA-binding protein
MQLLTVTGNLGKDVEKKDISGNTLYEFSVAATSKVKGEKKTTWYNVQCWGEFWKGVAEYLVKGKQVLVIGELQIREYEGNKGKGVSYDIRADKVELIGGGDKKEDTSFNHGANETKGGKSNPFEE